MKNLLALISAALIFVACGDTVENVSQMGMDVVASVDDLPKCTDDNNGDVAFVKEDGSTRVCVDGKWIVSSAGAAAFSCKAEELKDKSGIKIVCNGDSIGVVYNGEKGDSGKDGENGKAGTGCAMTGKTDSTVTVACGDSTMVIDLNVGLPADTLEADSERVAITFDSLTGYTQKGPFLKGSTVYLYELSDGRTLKQTNGNFTSVITRDDGRYKFSARDLVSQYAMVVVDGSYRNEVTGEKSDAPIRLRALTDMRKHADANINLLTHLEFDRVHYLVTHEKKTVKQAKKQAQKEIFKAFNFDTTGVSGSSEDLDVFGDSDADAALLAISILLQGDGSANDLSVILTLIANDMETDGVWDDSASKAQIADWAFNADAAGRFANFRKNVRRWRLSSTVPPFEKFIRNFYEGVYNFSSCDGTKNPFGTVKYVQVTLSEYYADSLYDIQRSQVRCACRSDKKWHFAYDVEKDVFGWPDTTIGIVKRGVFSQYPYIFTKAGWQRLESSVYKALLSNRQWPSSSFGFSADSAGSLYGIDDSAEGGASTIDWQIGNYRAITGTYSLDGGASVSEPYAGFGFVVAGVDAKKQRLAGDVSAWEGLCIDYESDVPVIFELESAVGKQSIILQSKNTELGYSCFGWDAFENGDAVSKALTAMNFKVAGTSGSSGSFTIESIYKISSYRNDPIPETQYTDGCGDLWCGESLDYTVDFGGGSIGHWFDINDQMLAGVSSITYPIGKTNVRLENVVEDVVDACHGICGTYSLKSGIDPRSEDVFYVMVGFTLTEDGSTPVDISSWDGICVTYESDMQMDVQMGLPSERETELSYDVPVKKLAKVKGMQVRNISWNEFVQGGWSPIEFSGAEAAMEVKSIRFAFYLYPSEISSSAKGDFAIYGIGRKGTCGL